MRQTNMRITFLVILIIAALLSTGCFDQLRNTVLRSTAEDEQAAVQQEKQAQPDSETSSEQTPEEEKAVAKEGFGCGRFSTLPWCKSPEEVAEQPANGGASAPTAGAQTGRQGERGERGLPGQKGETGPAGSAGPAGKDGKDGAKGDPGQVMTQEQFNTAYSNYVQTHGLPAGQKITKEEQQVALKEFFVKNPEVLRDLLKDHFKDNPPTGGATDAQVAAAVTAYVKANPIAQGAAGPAGKDGKDGTQGPQGPAGLPGTAGKDAIVSEVLVRTIIADLLAKNPSGLVSASGTLPCKGDKVATFAEVGGAGPQRQEIGGGGGQHADFYPNSGVKTISYILPPQKSFRWSGFGSIWEWNGPECNGYDYVTDATNYAKGRLDNGHSGLVIDLRGKEPVIVGNVANLTEQQIKDLLAIHNRSQEPTVKLSSFQVQASAAIAQPGGAAQPGCASAKEYTYTVNTIVFVDGPAIVHPWWNTGTSFGQSQVRVMVKAGESIVFVQMQGKVYIYQDNAACSANLDKEFGNASFPVKTTGELKAEGLAQ